MFEASQKRPRATPLITALLASLFFISGTIYSSEAEAPLSLFRAIDERLGHMESVALYKAQNQVAIEDIERETLVISAALALAEKHSLEPESIELFFRTQINAAKAIQYRYRAELLTSASSVQAVDLQQEVRPALDQLSIEIVSHFAALLESRASLGEDSRELFMSTVQNRLLADIEKNALFDALLEVRSSQ